jgi:hypothetical protein
MKNRIFEKIAEMRELEEEKAGGGAWTTAAKRRGQVAPAWGGGTYGLELLLGGLADFARGIERVLQGGRNLLEFHCVQDKISLSSSGVVVAMQSRRGD